MENIDPELLAVMREFNEYVTDFTNNAQAGSTPLMEPVGDLFTDISSLTSQECFARSFQIDGYAMYIRAELNENQARLSWCEDFLNKIVAEQWDQYDPYMKYELKRQLIISQNSFAPKLEKLRSRLKARVTILEDKLTDIRHMSQTVNELGKRKAYDDRT